MRVETYRDHKVLAEEGSCLQAALWLIWKSAPANDKMSVALPVGIFLTHAILGNQASSRLLHPRSSMKAFAC